MSDVAIRRAELADVLRMLELANDSAAVASANFATEPELLEDWQASWKATEARYPWLVATTDSDMIGFAKAGPHRARGAYAWTAEVTVYVDPKAHARGVGTRLYTNLVSTLREQRFETLLAGIVGGHAASERLHQKFGFVRCGTYHRAGFKLGAWHDVGYWELHLGDGSPPKPLRPVHEVWPPKPGR